MSWLICCLIVVTATPTSQPAAPALATTSVARPEVLKDIELEGLHATSDSEAEYLWRLVVKLATVQNSHTLLLWVQDVDGD